MKKKILSLVLTVCMVLSLLPAVSSPAAATTWTPYAIGTVSLLDADENILASARGDGWTWAYDTTTSAGTLTLTDAYIKGADSSRDSYGANLPDGTTIVLKGDSTIAGGAASQDSIGVYCRGALTIKDGDTAGVGSLSAVGGKSSDGDSMGLETYGSKGTLTIDSGKVTGLGGTANDSSYGIYAQTLIVSGSADVTGIAGTANGSGSNIKSCGVYCNSSASVEGGSLTAVGAYADVGESFGIETYNFLNVSGGTVVAQGGKSANNNSYGVRVDSGTVALTGGLLVASSGGCGTVSGVVSQALSKAPTDGAETPVPLTALAGAYDSSLAVYGDSETYTSNNNILTSTLDLSNNKTSSGWSNSTNSNGWKWDYAEAGSTLTLKNMIIVGTKESGSVGSFGIYGDENISIVYEGVNVVCSGTSESGKSYGIEVEVTGEKGLSLSGNGTLIVLGRQAGGSSYGIQLSNPEEKDTGSLKVSSGKVIALGGDAGNNVETDASCGLNASKKIQIGGGDVTAVGAASANSSGIVGVADVSVSGGHTVAVCGYASGENGISAGVCSIGTTTFSGSANVVAAGDGYGVATYSVTYGGGNPVITPANFQLGTNTSDTVTLTAMGGTGATNANGATEVSGKVVACDGGTYATAGTAVRFRLADAPVIAVAHDGSHYKEYSDFAEGWNEAVGTKNNEKTTVRLLADWTATTNATYGTSFGTGIGFGGGTASGAGFILVPEGKTITLDLNGHTIDRGLTAAQTDGEVICIDSANISAKYTEFTLADSAGESVSGAGNGTTGCITGGNNSGNGGGIYMAGNSVKCTIKGGCISGNRTAGNGGGIVTHGTTNGDFLITGGKITGNSAANGGGIYCTMCCDGISNCIIQGNTATTCGGGIYSDYLGGIRLGGATVVSGNAHGTNAVASTTGDATIGEGGEADNLYLTSGTTVNCLVGTNILATTGAYIGVTAEIPPTDGQPVNVAFIENSSVDYSVYYHSDNSSYYIKNTESGSDRIIELCAGAACTVTFDANGHGTAPAAIPNVTSGSTITAPTAPTESGYTFGGWYKEDACANRWNFASDIVTANTTLYAKWTASTYTVTFDANGHSTAPAALTGVTSGRTISAPTAPTASGYTFGGWYKEDTCANKWDFDTDTVTADTILYAKWTANGGGYVPSTPSTGKAEPVIVDGTVHDIGTKTTTDTTTTVTVDNSKLQEQLESAKESVIVPITSKTDTTVAQLVVKNVEDMAAKDMTLSVDLGGIQYNIPSKAVQTGEVMLALGATDPSKVPVNVTITQLTSDAVTIVNGTLQVPPVQFTVTASYGGKTVETSVFTQYVSRVIELSDGTDLSKITTAVVKEPDGTERHVPTFVFAKDGKQYAKINSLTNSTYALIYNQASFADAAGKWYENIVSEMASREILLGRDTGVFDGDASITRAEFAAVLVRALGLPASGTSKFTDVASTDWFSGAVGTAASYGLVLGYEDGSFRPNNNITRQEAMAMMQRAAKVAEFSGKTSELTAFGDAASVSDWAVSAAQYNVGSGLIVGDNGQLRPNDPITRAESATVVLRLLQKAGLVDVRSAT